MSGESDISAIISSDTSGFTEPILEAKSVAESFFTYLVDGGKAALATTGAILSQLVTEVGTVTRSVLQGAAQEFGAIALKTALLGGAATATTGYFVGFWNTMKIGLSVAGWFVPWLKAVSIGLTVATAGVWAYQKADEYLNGELTKSIVQFEQTTAAVEQLKSQLNQTAVSLGIVGDGLGSVGAQAAQAAVDWSGIGTVVRDIDSVVSFSLSAMSDGLKVLNKGFQGGSDAITDWLSPAGSAAAQLRAMATASADLISKQTEQATTFQTLRAIQDGAAAQAAHIAEVQRIASFETIDGVNAEITALQQRSAAMVLAGDADEETLKKTAALFLALENQKNNIASGKMAKKPEAEKKSLADTEIDQAAQALAKLMMGQDAATIAALQAAGATEQEVARLRDLQEQIHGVNAAKEAQKALDQALIDLKRQQDQMDERAGDQVANLKDEIDLLTGAATKAEVAKRKLLREGFTQEQTDEIARLQEMKDQLAEEKNKKSGKGGSTDLKAAFAGSQEAASILLRGIGGGKSVEQIATKQLGVQQQMLAAIKSNKIPVLQPISLGTV